MPNRQLTELLNKNHINFQTIKHSPAYTAHEIAQAAHIPGKWLAKTVIIKLDGKLAMLVLTASDKINFSLLENEIGKHIELASEKDFQNQFPECELGAMPPFGNLYKLSVYVDEKLTKDEDIAFNAGNHTELLRLKYKDFEKLVHPILCHASETKH